MQRRNRVRNRRAFFSLVVAILLLSGCAFKDIDKRNFVVGIGIDPSEKIQDGFRITLKLAMPIGSVKQEKSPNYAYISHDSETVADAIRMMETHNDKVLEFGHNRMIIIHEKLLSRDMGMFLDYFMRRGDIQLLTNMATTEESAEEVLKFIPETETPASNALNNFFGDTGSESPYIVTTYLFQARRDVLSKGVDAVLPVIRIDKDESEFIINEAVVIKPEDNPVKLTQTETKYLNSLIYHAVGFSYKVKENDFVLVLNLDQVNMKYKIIEENGRSPRIDMKITKVGVVGESNKRLDMNNLKKYNEIVAKDIKEKVMELLTKLQEHNVDPFGFGLRYRATRLSYEGVEDEWDSLYPDVEFNVEMDVKLKSTGTIE